jgi:hypothetical protein
MEKSNWRLVLLFTLSIMALSGLLACLFSPLTPKEDEFESLTWRLHFTEYGFIAREVNGKHLPIKLAPVDSCLYESRWFLHKHD